MPSLNPYLNFPGTTEAAFEFYRSVFGGSFIVVQRFSDTEVGDHLPEGDKDKIMHIALPIGNGNILMGTDALESMGQTLSYGNNFHLSINTDSEAETETLFNALSAEGSVVMPLEKMQWGDYFGMLTDKFGMHWMLSYTMPNEQ